MKELGSPRAAGALGAASSVPTRVGVVGAGSWGTALALLLHRNGHRVRLWTWDDAVAREVREAGENRSYLPGIRIPEGLDVSADLAHVLDQADLVVSVSPSQFVDSVMEQAVRWLPPGALVVSASKGIETGTLRRMDEVLGEHLPRQQHDRLCVLSGPSFAQEVAEAHPTAVVLASRSREARLEAQTVFSSDSFRVYTDADVVGVELGGAVKNVIALAAGMAVGLGLGRNAQAALITRGLAEITRLGQAVGADPLTFSGLAGVGDLVLTCTGELSRNRTVGVRLGRGEKLDRILGEMRAVAEGVRTTEAVHQLALRHHVEMPITAQVHRMLNDEVTPADALHELMTRDPKPERWGR